MGFSEEEVRATVEKLLLSVVRRPVDSLGARSVAVTFNDIQEAAAGVYMLYPRAPFYTVYLGALRLLTELRQMQPEIDTLSDALSVLRRRVLPVRDVSSLVNAKVALLELESVVDQSKVTDVTSVPSYTRFNQNVSRFLEQAVSIKQDGRIVPTPQEARVRIPPLTSSFRQSAESVVTKVRYLEGSLDDFVSVGLPKLVSASVISKARQLVESRSKDMENMSEMGRLEVLRGTVLDLLGAKAAITKFGSSPSMGSAISTGGTALAFADSSRPAVGATLHAQKHGPYITLPDDDSNRLQVWLDGAAPPPAPPAAQIPSPDDVFYFPVSFYARLEGIVSEPFSLVAGENDELVLLVNGISTVNVPLVPGTRTTVEICAYINSAFDTAFGTGLSPFVAEPFYFPLKYDSQVDVVSANTIQVAGASSGMLFPVDPSTGQSFLQVGDSVTFYASGTVGTFEITGVQPSLAEPKQLIVSPALLTPGSGQSIQCGNARRNVRIVPRDKRASCASKGRIQIKTPNQVAASAAASLGFFGEMVSVSKPTDATILATFINEHSSRTRGSVAVEPAFENIMLRTDAARPLNVAAFWYRGAGSVVVGGTGVLAVTLAPLPEDVSQFIGAALVLRSGFSPDVWGTVVSVGPVVGDTVDVQVSFTSAVIAGANLVVEVGPSAGIAADMAVVVPLGVNEGRYYIDYVTPIPFEFVLRDTLPRYRDGFAQPEFMRADIGFDHLVLSSVETSTKTQVSVRDDAGLLFLTAGPHTGHGETQFLQLSELPRELEEGSIVEHWVNRQAPQVTASVVSTFQDRVVRLDEFLPTTFSSDFGSTLPYLRLRKRRIVDFSSFRLRLQEWLRRPDVSSLSRYFMDLNRLVNPLLQNENPQNTDVVAALNRLNDLYSLLLRSVAEENGKNPESTLEAVLESYEVDVVGEIDALLGTFRERGADRAIEFLLQGRFAAFFGFDKDDVSYAGSFQKAMREVAREDLPVRSVDRADRRTNSILSSGKSPNYEYDSSDLDPTPTPDYPGGL